MRIQTPFSTTPGPGLPPVGGQLPAAVPHLAAPVGATAKNPFPLPRPKEMAAQLRAAAANFVKDVTVIAGVTSVEQGHQLGLWENLLEASVAVRDGADVLLRHHRDQKLLANQMHILAADIWNNAYRAEQYHYYHQDHAITDNDRAYFTTEFQQADERARRAADLLDPPAPAPAPVPPAATGQVAR